MITVRLSGGMGNQMFQYAAGRALAVKNNTTVELDTTYLENPSPRKNFTARDYSLDVFTIEATLISHNKTPLQIFFHKIKNKFFPAKGVERSFQFDPKVLSLGPNAFLEGYWQSPRYFSSISDTIKNDFTLKHSLSEASRALMAEIRNTVSVAVHVRRGDYVGHSYHDVGITQTYYDQGLQYIADTQAIDKVYVFSDDIAWCKEHLQFPFETIYVGEEHAGIKGEGHMMLMSACKHFVIPNSTFSWWAAWLSGYEAKIVIAPKEWFTDKSINTNDLIPEEWVRM